MLLLISLPVRIKLASSVNSRKFPLSFMFPDYLCPSPNKPSLSLIRLGFSQQTPCSAPILPHGTQQKTNSKETVWECHRGGVMSAKAVMCDINLISISTIAASQDPRLCYLVNNVSRLFSLERLLTLSVAAGHGWVISRVHHARLCFSGQSTGVEVR